MSRQTRILTKLIPVTAAVWSAWLSTAPRAMALDSLHVTAPTAPSRTDGTYTRMFPGLPYAHPTDEKREQAKTVGAKGGILDAQDILTDPVQSILNPAVFSPHNPDIPNMTAGVYRP